MPRRLGPYPIVRRWSNEEHYLSQAFLGEFISKLKQDGYRSAAYEFLIRTLRLYSSLYGHTNLLYAEKAHLIEVEVLGSSL